MTILIAPCGLDCGQCEAYVLTQADDPAGLDALAAKWRVEFNAPDMTAKDLVCDGCLATNGRLGSYCAICEIRKCAQERAVATCAQCADFGCEKLTGFWQNAPQAKENLGALRK